MTLSVTELAIARAGRPVLSGVSFTLEAGQALVLRGPNGVGKTTLLRCLAGLQPPLAGRISGADERIAYAAHADGLKATLSARENLAFWARVFGAGGVDAALDAYALGGLADRPAGALSAGQKRRLGLARLLVTGRPIWVCDEPTVSLDRAAVAMFAAAVGRHLGAGGSAVIATHIELGLDAVELDLAGFRAAPQAADRFEEHFL